LPDRYLRPPPAPGLHSLSIKEAIALRREDARWWLAIGSGLATIGVMGGILGSCIAGDISLNTAKDLALTFLTPLATLTVAVFGFYFGSKD